MIKIKIPNNFLPERKYIISTLFDEFLGLNYEIETYNKNDYKIVLDNKKELIIKDSFFSNFKNQDYLSVQNIPQSPLQKSNNKFAKQNFWTWEERINTEIKEINRLIKNE